MIQVLDNSSGKLVELCREATESFIWVGLDEPIKIVFKLRFEDMEPVKLSGLEDEDLNEDHDRLHRYYSEWLVGEHREEDDWSYGDLLQKHAFVVAELKNRGRGCGYDDELAKPIRKGLVETIKEATESFVWDGRDDPVLIIKGGPGSGHHGHAGRPGQVGGSSPGGAFGRVRVKALAVSTRQLVEQRQPAYEEEVGLGPCGPVAALVTEQLRDEGLDARMAFAEYEYGPTEFEIGGHYVTVVMEKGKPVYIVDASNYFSEDALKVVPATHEQWGRFGELEWGVKGGDSLDFISELWNRGDIEWWRKRLT